MALQATEQGIGHPPPPAAAADHPHQPTLAAPPSARSSTGVAGCSKRQASAAADLPDDILLDILSRLPVKPLFRFKCVSKSWLGLVDECLRKAPPILQGLFYWDWNYAGSARFFDLLGRSEPPVDPSFPFLKDLPEIERITLIDSCSGLVLFRHTRRSDSGYMYQSPQPPLGYIVCNPATQEWVAVPRSDCDAEAEQRRNTTRTRVIFDPAASSRFDLVQFSFGSEMRVSQVHTYSSESRAWSRRAAGCWSHGTIIPFMGSAFVDGMIHLGVLHSSDAYQNSVVAVDARGEKRRVIRWPEEERGSLICLGQSQGLLHCVSGHMHQHEDHVSQLSIWVLEDYGTEHWMLKGRVSSAQLFGTVDEEWLNHVTVTFLPDRSLAIFFGLSKRELVSYDMESKEVTAIGTLHGGLIYTVPYIPYFAESSVFARKH